MVKGEGISRFLMFLFWAENEKNSQSCDFCSKNNFCFKFSDPFYEPQKQPKGWGALDVVSSSARLRVQWLWQSWEIQRCGQVPFVSHEWGGMKDLQWSLHGFCADFLAGSNDLMIMISWRCFFFNLMWLYLISYHDIIYQLDLVSWGVG